MTESQVTNLGMTEQATDETVASLKQRIDDLEGQLAWLKSLHGVTPNESEAEIARRRLYDLFMQAPAMIAITRGSDHIIELVNPQYVKVMGRRDPTTLLGRPGREAVPELIEQGFFDLMDRVYQTGEPYVGNEVPVQLYGSDEGLSQTVYFNFVYQPSRDLVGEVDGILLHAVEVTDQVRARQRAEELTTQLITERERLAIAQKAGRVGTFEWFIPENRIVWTPELEALYGLPPNGFEGRYENWTRRVHPEDLGRAEASVQEALQGGPAYNVEFRVVWPNGSIHWVQANGDTYFDEAGQPLRLIGVNIDVTERKQAELDLSHTEARLSQFMQSNVVGIMFSDNDGYVSQANDALLDMLGYNREDLYARRIKGYDITPPEYHALDSENFQQIQQTGYGPPYEKEFFRKDGSRVPVLIGYTLVGETRREGVFFVLDLTQPKKIERRQQFLAQAGSVLSASLDMEATLQSLSQLIVPAFADWSRIDLVDEESGQIRSYGLAHTDPLKVAQARALDERYPVDPQALYGVAQVIRSGQSEFWPSISQQDVEANTTEPDMIEMLQTVQFKSALVVPLTARDHTLGALTLITTANESNHQYDEDDLVFAQELGRRAGLAVDNARLYRQTQQALETQQELDYLKDLFMSVASHELRTPLTAIKGYGQLLQRSMGRAIGNEKTTAWQTEQPKMVRSLDTILYQTERMADLVNQLLDFSRIQNRQLILQISEGENLSDLLRQVVEQHRLNLGENRLKLELSAEDLLLRFDKARVEQVLDNLINNAFKYSPPDSAVTLEVERRADEVVVAVQDQGVGISPGDQAHIFERFFRARTKETARVDGLGLGLYVSYEIISQHGGRMWLESQPGQGSTFYFSLPLTEG